VRDGSFELEGESGASFAVVASEGERRVEATIVITKDGAPSVPALDLGAAAPSARRPEIGRFDPKAKGAGTLPATAAPTSVATAVPSSGKPPAKEDW
jgi:hypothetical protein